MATWIGSKDWSIAFRGFIVAIPGAAGISAMWFNLWNERMSFACPVIFQGGGFGGGVSAGGVFGDYKHFTTSSFQSQPDFTGFGSTLFSAVGPGGSGTVGLNFFPIDHSPLPIIVTGVPVGAGASFGWNAGRFTVLSDTHITAPGPSPATAGTSAGSSDNGLYVAMLDDCSDSMDDVTSAYADYLQNNTDPVYQNANA